MKTLNILFLEQILKYFGSKLNRQQQEQYEALLPLYSDWNSKINVISRKDMDAFYERHVLHSLSIAALFSLQPGQKVIDLGTGGGFPGIPLAIFFPETDFTLVDSTGKKVSVVRSIAASLNLKNVKTLQIRAEEYKPRGQFNTILTRAVAPMDKLIEWSRPLLKRKPDNKGPYGILALKGGNIETEIEPYKNACRIYALKNIFKEEWFAEKLLVHYLP